MFWVLKKKWNFFSFPPSPSQWKKNLKISGRQGGGWGAGERLAFRESQPHHCSPQQWTLFLHIPQEPLGPSPTAHPGPWRRKSCAALCPHPQLPLPAVVLPSWQPSLSALTHSHSPHENQATASWIILKASEAGRTWQHPACSPSSLSGSHCRLLYKARLFRHPTCPSLLLPALGSMDR